MVNYDNHSVVYLYSETGSHLLSSWRVASPLIQLHKYGFDGQYHYCWHRTVNQDRSNNEIRKYYIGWRGVVRPLLKQS